MTTSAYDMLRSVATESDRSGSTTTLPLSALHRDPTQPRQKFDESTLADLAASIRQSGIIEPLVVTPHSDRPGEWTILVGERRQRAAAKAGLEAVPVIIRMEVSEAERLILQMTENEQRTDLSLRERGVGYLRLRDLLPEKTAQELATMLGKKPAHFNNTLLAANVTQGPAFDALQEDIIKDPDALRLFMSLAREDQTKLLSNAKTAAVTLTRQMVKRFKETKQAATTAAQRRAPDPSAGPTGNLSEDNAEPGSDSEPLASQATIAQGRGAAPTQRTSPQAPKDANDYLSAFTWRHWEILFKHLGIPLPEDPDDAGYTLLEFLEARAAQD